jgi:hypothetical protein
MIAGGFIVWTQRNLHFRPKACRRTLYQQRNMEILSKA